MTETSSERFDVGDGVEMAALVLGILLTVGAAYYTGNTGDWIPLAGATMMTGLLVVLTMDD